MIEAIKHGAVTELRLDRPPVNALNQDLLEALLQAHRKAVKENAHVIVLSGKEGVFSAGLDVPALLGLSRNAMQVFWSRFFDLLFAVYGSPVPVVAALTGHAPGGGGVLAIHCDYRVAADGDFRIGLNEVQVGLQVPPTIIRVMEGVVGRRQAALLTMTGKLLPMRAALEVGLVDEVVPPEETVARAIEFARSLLELSPQAMNGTRLAARQAVLSGKPESNDVRRMTEGWFSAETQAAMRALVERLGK